MRKEYNFKNMALKNNPYENPYYHPGENPSVDLIVINPFDEVLMIRRSSESEACPSMIAFPGGFINTLALRGEAWREGLENPEVAALRELAEETNLRLDNKVKLTLVGIYKGNNRDPRDNVISWSKSYAFLFVIDQETFDNQKDHIRGMDDAEGTEWISFLTLLNMELAFDHKEILRDALKLLGKS